MTADVLFNDNFVGRHSAATYANLLAIYSLYEYVREDHHEKMNMLRDSLRAAIGEAIFGDNVPEICWDRDWYHRNPGFPDMKIIQPVMIDNNGVWTVSCVLEDTHAVCWVQFDNKSFKSDQFIEHGKLVQIFEFMSKEGFPG